MVSSVNISGSTHFQTYLKREFVFPDQAVQNALLCLRNESTWSLGSTLGAIGWRLRKHYFKATTKPPDNKSSNKLVKSGSQSHAQIKQHTNSAGIGSSSHNSNGSKSGSSEQQHHQHVSAAPAQLEGVELVIEWLEYGPDKFVDDKELGGILKSLMGMQHRHIESVVYAGHNEHGGLVIRK